MRRYLVLISSCVSMLGASVLSSVPVYAVNGIDCATAGGACTAIEDCMNSGNQNLNVPDCEASQICCGKLKAPLQSESPTPPPKNLPAVATKGAHLELPPCTQSGNCTVDDIVTTGAAFANLLTELSAALFFATFIYGGAMYLLSFGDKGRVTKGKDALKGAAIGMAIVLSAWTLVNYVANALLGKV